MQTITEQIEASKAHASENAHLEPIVIETCNINDAWAQGDIRVQYLGGEAKPKDIKRTANPQAQLAPGTTMGSRHVLRNFDECEMWEREVPHPLVGPIIYAPSGVDVTHPEHGDVCIKEAGWYGIGYQRAYSTEEIRRMMD